MQALTFSRDLRIPVGVAIVGPQDEARLVSVDWAGQLWVLAVGSRVELVKVALARFFRVYASLAKLCDALLVGLAVGIVHELWRGGVLFVFESAL